MNPLPLDELNRLPADLFAAHFAGVLEHSPHYAAQVAGGRPYASAEDLAAAFAHAARLGTPDERVALIRAHPDLAGKAALAGDLTPESAQEQASAGLDRLSADEYAEFQALNDAYHRTFGLPYVVCVREHDKASIFEGARRRLRHEQPLRRLVRRTQRIEAMIPTLDRFLERLHELRGKIDAHRKSKQPPSGRRAAVTRAPHDPHRDATTPQSGGSPAGGAAGARFLRGRSANSRRAAGHWQWRKLAAASRESLVDCLLRPTAFGGRR